MIGKAELAKALGWSRPRLDRRLETDRHFPVANRSPWQFDLAAVKAYLDPPAVPSIGQIIDRAQLADLVKPPAPAPPSARHRGEATARQRKDEADAQLKELKLQQQKDQLVSRAEVTAAVATMLTVLGKSLDGLPDAICRMLGLPDAANPVIREQVDDMRRAAVGDMLNSLTIEHA